MKNSILSLSTLFFLFLVLTSCSNQENHSFADDSADLALEITSRSLETENQEDIQLLLVRKWENIDSKIYLDLRFDGSFEGALEKEEMVFGLWTISQDQKKLKLVGDQGQEGKGKNFQASFDILEMSFETMKVKNEQGVEIEFIASK